MVSGLDDAHIKVWASLESRNKAGGSIVMLTGAYSCRTTKIVLGTFSPSQRPAAHAFRPLEPTPSGSRRAVSKTCHQHYSQVSPDRSHSLYFVLNVGIIQTEFINCNDLRDTPVNDNSVVHGGIH
jgi:hypothetical protein